MESGHRWGSRTAGIPARSWWIFQASAPYQIMAAVLAAGVNETQNQGTHPHTASHSSDVRRLVFPGEKCGRWRFGVDRRIYEEHERGRCGGDCRSEGQIVWSEGFGYADVEQRVPVWPGITRFRVGSTAKSMTAVALGQPYEQGRLDLDAPVQDYVPSFPEKEGTITTRLLAGHPGSIRVCPPLSCYGRTYTHLSQSRFPHGTTLIDSNFFLSYHLPSFPMRIFDPG